MDDSSLDGFKNGVTGINLVTGKQYNFYPNPAAGLLFIDAPSAGGSCVITDITGRQVLSKAITAGHNSIDVHTLVPGMYMVKLYEGKQLAAVRKISKE